jgi:phage gpG-like protein
MVEITWDTHELQALAVRLNGAPSRAQARAQQVIVKGANDIEVDGKIFCPVDTGNLRNSISTDIGTLEAEIGPTADYGIYVELGVPHSYIIRAKDGGMLHFVVDGHEVFVKQVTHPPSAPRPYMGKSADRNFPGIERALGIVGEEALL